MATVRIVKISSRIDTIATLIKKKTDILELSAKNQSVKISSHRTVTHLSICKETTSRRLLRITLILYLGETNRNNAGQISADRSTETTFLLTIPGWRQVVYKKLIFAASNIVCGRA